MYEMNEAVNVELLLPLFAYELQALKYEEYDNSDNEKATEDSSKDNEK